MSRVECPGSKQDCRSTNVRFSRLNTNSFDPYSNSYGDIDLDTKEAGYYCTPGFEKHCANPYKEYCIRPLCPCSEPSSEEMCERGRAQYLYGSCGSTTGYFNGSGYQGNHYGQSQYPNSRCGQCSMSPYVKTPCQTTRFLESQPLVNIMDQTKFEGSRFNLGPTTCTNCGPSTNSENVLKESPTILPKGGWYSRDKDGNLDCCKKSYGCGSASSLTNGICAKYLGQSCCPPIQTCCTSEKRENPNIPAPEVAPDPPKKQPSKQSSIPRSKSPTTPASSKPVSPASSKPVSPASSKPTTPVSSRPTTPISSRPTSPIEPKPTKKKPKKRTPSSSRKTTPSGSRKTTPCGSKKTTPSGSKKTTPSGSRKPSPCPSRDKVRDTKPCCGTCTCGKSTCGTCGISPSGTGAYGKTTCGTTPCGVRNYCGFSSCMFDYGSKKNYQSEFLSNKCCGSKLDTGTDDQKGKSIDAKKRTESRVTYSKKNDTRVLLDSASSKLTATKHARSSNMSMKSSRSRSEKNVVEPSRRKPKSPTISRSRSDKSSTQDLSDEDNDYKSPDESEKSTKSMKSDKTFKSDKSIKSEKSGKPEKILKQEKSEKSLKSEKISKSDKSLKSDKSSKSIKSRKLSGEKFLGVGFNEIDDESPSKQDSGISRKRSSSLISKNASSTSKKSQNKQKSGIDSKSSNVLEKKLYSIHDEISSKKSLEQLETKKNNGKKRRKRSKSSDGEEEADKSHKKGKKSKLVPYAQSPQNSTPTGTPEEEEIFSEKPKNSIKSVLSSIASSLMDDGKRLSLMSLNTASRTSSVVNDCFVSMCRKLCKEKRSSNPCQYPEPQSACPPVLRMYNPDCSDYGNYVPYGMTPEECEKRRISNKLSRLIYFAAILFFIAILLIHRGFDSNK